MRKYRVALVSWTKGPDKDKSSIIPDSWIINFDKDDTNDRTFLVECQTTNSKKPFEDAKALQLAGKSVLHRLTLNIIFFLPVTVLLSTAAKSLLHIYQCVFLFLNALNN